MEAAILAVGTELLGVDRVDTNSLALTEILYRFGVRLKRKGVVGDEVGEIASELERLLQEVDLVLLTGGLGPTSDDLTREATSHVLGRKLILDKEVLRDIEAKFSAFGMEMPKVNRKQAELIDGAQWLPNPRGTAPGMKIEATGSTIFLFPGVPNELEGLIADSLEPWLRENTDGEQTEIRVLKVAGLTESKVEERLEPVYAEHGSDDISVLASPGDIHVRLSASGPAKQRADQLSALSKSAEAALGRSVYARQLDDDMETVVGRLLRAQAKSVATAESCTGGLVAERLTRVPGSSDYFLGSAITYNNQLKEDLLGVSRQSLEREGAVSKAVVSEMAAGVVERFGSDFGIAISGVAGPGGGTEEKPVGTVHLAVAESSSESLDHRQVRLPGDRRRIRWLASQVALDMLRRRLQDAEPGSL